MFGAFHDIFNLISEQIFVLFSEPDHRVINLFGGVLDTEKSRWKIKIGRRKVFLLFVVVSEFCDERRFIRRSNRTPFIEKVKYTQGVVVDELNDFEVV